MSRWAGRRTWRSTERSTPTWASAISLQRLAPDGEHGVGRQQRVAQHAGLLGVGLLGLVAGAGVAEVEVAGDAQQLVGADRAARAARTVRDVGLDRPQVGAPVEDDRQRVGQGQAAHAHGHGDRCLGVDEGPAQQLVGVLAGGPVLLVHRSLLRSRDPRCERLHHRGTHDYRHIGGNSIPPRSNSLSAMKLIYKPFGIIFGILAGTALEEALRGGLGDLRQGGAAQADHAADDLAQGHRRRGGRGRHLQGHPRRRRSRRRARASRASRASGPARRSPTRAKPPRPSARAARARAPRRRRRSARAARAGRCRRSRRRRRGPRPPRCPR